VTALAAGAIGQEPPWNFDAMLAVFGLQYAEEDRHTALGDARMARDLYDAVLSGKPVVSE
jgi:DNA polymerase III epsilon subunit-like protein